MHFKPATLVAALLTSRVAALALPAPQEAEVEVGGGEGVDLIAAYNEIEAAIPDEVAAPEGTGNKAVPEDSDAVHDAAVDEASSDSGVQKRDIFKRGTCKPQPSQYTSGPDVSTLTADQWEQITLWRTTALNAPTPDGFFANSEFRALTAAARAQPYRGFTSQLSSYDTNKCAARCKSIEGCTSFNIYFERNPTINLDKKNCPTSTAQTIIKCGFYGLALSADQATEEGQFTGADFFTSKAGSNAYSLIADTPDGFGAPINFGVYTIRAPSGSNALMGTQTFPGVSYNPQICADVCKEKTAYNQRQAAKKGPNTPFRTCRFFNSYVALKNEANGVFTCAFFTTVYGKEQATELEQFDSAGNRYSHINSLGYPLLEQQRL